MISMIQGLARVCIAAAVVSAFLPIAPSHAQNFAFVSATASGTSCTTAAPCASILTALQHFLTPLRIICINGASPDSAGIPLNYTLSGESLDIDCPLGFEAQLSFPNTITNTTVRLRHLDFSSVSVANAIIFNASGTLVLEDCVFTEATGVALDIEPSGSLNLVIRNSRISNNVGGILLKPAAGGSINATLDHVTIADNGGGGTKIDTTNGPVTLDVTDSVFSNNSGSGINAVGNAGGQAIVSIKNSVIAKNGVVGVQANGANAGVLLQTTLLDQNAAGATSIVNGGNMFSYGNNSIVGSLGSGFNQTGQLH